ncbi:MAG: hypothetical protein ACYCPS_04620 [Candidatus Saccharimonadales bacterium]
MNSSNSKEAYRYWDRLKIAQIENRLRLFDIAEEICENSIGGKVQPKDEIQPEKLANQYFNTQVYQAPSVSIQTAANQPVEDANNLATIAPTASNSLGYIRQAIEQIHNESAAPQLVDLEAGEQDVYSS